MRNRWTHQLKKITTLLLVLALIVNASGPITADGETNDNLTVSTVILTGDSTLEPNEVVTVRMTYGYGSSKYQKIAPILTLQVPTSMEIVNGTISNHVVDEDGDDIGDYSINANKTIITYNMIENAGNGYTGFVDVTFKFRKGVTTSTSDGDVVITLEETKDQDDIKEKDTLGMTFTPEIPNNKLTVTKSKTVPVSDPVVDSNVSYKIYVDGNDNNGLNYDDLIVVDTYPENAVVVNSGGGVVDEENHTISWHLSEGIGAGSYKNLYVTLKYPSEYFNAPLDVTNTAEARATDIAGGEISDSGSISHGIVDAIYKLDPIKKSSRQSNDRYSVGQQAIYEIEVIKNSGNVPLEEVVLIDTIPDGIDVTGINIGRYNITSDAALTVKYQINGDDTWISKQSWTDMSIYDDKNPLLDVTDLSLGSNDYMSKVMFVFPYIHVGFTSLTGGNAIRIIGDVKSEYVNETPVLKGDEITNRITLGAENVTTDSALVLITVDEPKPWIYVDKKASTSTLNESVEEELEYTVTIVNRGYATGNLNLTDGKSIVIEDDYDETAFNQFSFSTSSLSVNGTNSGNLDPTSKGSIANNGLNDGVQQWTLTDTVLEPGESVSFTYKLKVIKGTLVGNYDNQVTIAPMGFGGDELDDRIVASNYVDAVKVYVRLNGSMQSTKYIKGEFDEDYKDGEGLKSSTIGGGSANFKLKVDNSGTNAPVNHIIVVDKLPSIDDEAVLNSETRLTEWVPYLVDNSFVYYKMDASGGITSISASDVTLTYTTATITEASYGLEMKDPTQFSIDGWQEWVVGNDPEDLTAITGVAFDFGENLSLYPSEQLYIEFDMRSPLGTPNDLIAWNSFAFNATYPNEGGGVLPFEPNEPNKVGVKTTLIPEDHEEKYSIGDHIWLDSDYNGQQNESDAGINNILVYLYKDKNGNGVLEDSEYNSSLNYTRTGNSFEGKKGYYSFPLLAPGSYFVGYQMPLDEDGHEIYEATVANNGANVSDSDFTAKNDDHMYISEPITFVVDSNNNNDQDLSMDAGLFQYATIGNFVWRDLNGDGIQNDGGVGVEDITVELYSTADMDNPVKTTTTGALGIYLFDEVVPGEYILKYLIDVVGHEYIVSPQNSGDDTLDSDGHREDADVASLKAQTESLTSAFTVESNETNLSLDLGLFEYASIGNLVWVDSDRTGSQTGTINGTDNGDEQGYDGMTVNLYQGPNKVADMQTDDGYYLFDDLEPGAYSIEFTLPTAYSISPKDQGDNLLDSDGEADSIYQDTKATTVATTLVSGEKDLSWDLGIYKSFSLGNYVWFDEDGDGIQESEPVSLSGVDVSLYSSTNKFIQKVTTGGDGLYSFTDLAIGTYYIKATKDGYGPTRQNIGQVDDDIATDSDVSRVTLKSDSHTFSAATTEEDRAYLHLDVGLFEPAKLGDFVWDDWDFDGVQDAGEPGIAGVKVELIDSDGSITEGTTSTFTTGDDGKYVFTNLLPDTYSIEFTFPEGYYVTKQNQPLDDVDETIDSDADIILTSGGAAVISGISIKNKYDIKTEDLGLYKKASIGDIVWSDANRNGLQDEPKGLADDALSLSQRQDNGVAGIKVSLRQDNGTVDNTSDDVIVGEMVTDEYGAYQFNELDPGTYYVQFDDIRKNFKYYVVDAIQGEDSSNDSDASVITRDTEDNPTLTRTENITLKSGDNNTEVDLGLFAFGELGDRVWLDTNRNGLQDDGENGYKDITVNLYKKDTDGLYVELEDKSTKTDINGEYLFAELYAGTYKIEFVMPAGYTASEKDVNDTEVVDSNLDSDGTPVVSILGGSITTDTAEIDEIILKPTDKLMTYDLGIYETLSLGDYVWVDVDGDQLQDAVERGLQGVAVELYSVKVVNSKQVLTKIATTTTNTDGAYRFDGLYTGDWLIKVVAPESYKFVAKDAGDDADDSDFNSDGKTDVFTLDSDSVKVDMTIDAGLYIPPTIGDFIWEDIDYDGIQDSGEPGIEGVQVQLKLKQSADSYKVIKVGTADYFVTGDDGRYEFEDLVPGTYTLDFTYPDNYYLTKRNSEGDDGSVDYDLLDSDAEVTTANLHFASISDFVLVHNEVNKDYDMGLYRKASLGDYVWLDRDYNGRQDDTSEFGLNGIKVDLYEASTLIDQDSTPIKTITTARNNLTGRDGYYKFTDLEPGDYKVHFSGLTYDVSGVTKNYLVTIQDKDQAIEGDSADKVDSDSLAGSKSQVSSPSVTLSSGQDYDYLDLGLFAYAEVGDEVWLDDNRNGLQDESDSGYGGVTVNLYMKGDDGTFTATKTTTTKADGSYLFKELREGEYYIEYIIPENFTVSEKGAGSDSDIDSDGWPTYTPTYTYTDGIQDRIHNEPKRTTPSAKTDYFTLHPTDEPMDYDLGIYESFSLGDRVWLEDLGDDVQGSDDTVGVAGLDVYLYHEDDMTNPVLHTKTDDQGEYLFEGLQIGGWQVEVILTGAYEFVAQNVGNDETIDSDINHDTGRSEIYRLDANSVKRNLTLDAGVFRHAGVGDYVWYDYDFNGLQDENDKGIEGVKVQLREKDTGDYFDFINENNVVQDFDVTDAHGYYFFNEVPLGDYNLEFTLDDGFYVTKQDMNDVDPLTVDDMVDSDGEWLDHEGGLVVIKDIHLSEFESDDTQDIGVYQKVIIGGDVWLDADYDGIQGTHSNEKGIEGIKVTLHSSTNPEHDGKVTTSGTDGKYEFTDLDPGSYYVAFSDLREKQDYIVTKFDQANDLLDSNGAAGVRDATTTETITLKGGETDYSLDLGLFAYAELGNRVWHDLDKDGRQDTGEPGISGITVTLTYGDQTLTTETDSIGEYYFKELMQGDYLITFELPTNYSVSPINIGLDTKDSDGHASNNLIDSSAITDTVTLKPTDVNHDQDLGIYDSYALGNRVWIDANADGLQEAGEIGLGGVNVSLYDGEKDTFIEETTTDSDGLYEFDDLSMGSYYVKVTVPSGYLLSSQNSGLDDTIDTDVNTTSGISDVVTFTSKSSQSNDALDIGVYQLAGLGNFVWEDLDYDGVWDAGEVGIPGVVVRIKDKDGQIVTVDGQTSQVTDSLGNYFFGGLQPGEYNIEFDLPTDYYLSKANVGADDDLDSDALLTSEASSTSIIKGIVLEQNELDRSNDMGLYRYGSLGDYMWYDMNHNGYQDNDEDPVVDMEVTLIQDGITIARTQTDVSGNYLFDDLKPGTYSIQFATWNNYVFTRSNRTIQGTNSNDDTLDSDPIRSGLVQNIEVTSWHNRTDIDAGIYYYPNRGSADLDPETETDAVVPEETTEPETSTAPILDDPEEATIVRLPIPEGEDIVLNEQGYPTQIIFKPSIEVKEIIVVVPPDKGDVEIIDDLIVYAPGPEFDGEDHIGLILVTPEDEEEFFDIDILEELPEAVPELPRTSGIPTDIFIGFGTILIGAGLGLKRKRN